MINTGFIRQVGIRHWAVRNFKRQFTKRVLKRDNRMCLPTGLTILLPRHSESASEVYVTGANMDWGAEALFSKFCSRDRDFFDVGAHIGYYSMYLAPLVRKVYAFEPDPRNIPSLQINAGMAGNVEIVQMAVSARSGKGRLNVSGSSSVNTLEVAGDKSIDVRITSIDDFVAGVPSLDPALIKTDVEGHDLEALRGMVKTTARCQPLILTECNNAAELPGLCVAWRYFIFAFTRDRITLKTDLRQLSSTEELRNHWYKMLFLVPQRLLAAFVDHQHGSK